MAFDHSPRAERRPAHGATLPMRSLPRFSAEDLVAEIAYLLRGSPARIDIEPALTSVEGTPAYARFWSRPKLPPTVGITVNGITIAVTGHDRPAFAPEDLARIDVSGWEGGRAQLARGRAHVEVAEIHAALYAEFDDNHDRAIAVTVVSAAVARLVDPVGIVWHASLRGVPASALPGIVQDIAERRTPTPLWLSCASVPASCGRPAGVTTRGLFPLLGAEVEVADTRLSGEGAAALAIALAEQIIGNGEAPGHGARLNYGAGHEFMVRHFPRGAGSAVPVLALVPEVHIEAASAAA